MRVLLPFRPDFKVEPSLAIAALSIVLLALAGFRPLAAYAESPAPDKLIRLDDRLMRTSRVRITTPSGRLVAEGVRASAEGLAYQNILQAAPGETRPIPGRIPWEETIRVDKPSNHAATGAIVSGVILGLAYWGIAADKSGNDPGAGTAALGLVPVLGIGIGALIPAWHPIYRNPASAK